MKAPVLLLLLTLTGICSLQAQPLRVAVAANAQSVAKILQADFKKRTGIDIEIISGSSGKLTAQIQHGAPYHLFLSADMEFPAILFKSGFGAAPPKTYARGRLILCAASDLSLSNWPGLLKSRNIRKIAIANPKLAPYGKAAEEALKRSKLWNAISSKLVFAESIGQVNTYILTGAVDVGFTTEALVHESSSRGMKWIRIPADAYSSLDQGVILLKYAEKNNHAKAVNFYRYLSSPAAKQIFNRYGYTAP